MISIFKIGEWSSARWYLEHRTVGVNIGWVSYSSLRCPEPQAVIARYRKNTVIPKLFSRVMLAQVGVIVPSAAQESPPGFAPGWHSNLGYPLPAGHKETTIVPAGLI
jgi:hypothetical protein